VSCSNEKKTFSKKKKKEVGGVGKREETDKRKA
jgi:hypothetical protein